MLKFIYTEAGIYLEPLTQGVDEWLSLRQKLAWCVGETIITETSTAAFLLPIHLFEQTSLEAVLQQEVNGAALYVCDEEYVEVSLPGIWISTDFESSEGVFVTRLSARAEALIIQLWQSCHAYAFLEAQ
ncbi:alr0857 family protein [Leptolyngbya sp. FACHB-261]|uniref:alr0857 family protein n=1 Tax=Leptolyngbya sp. FACHB-261 TaxID=2692806 RepID=UPI001686F1D8|nr:alr0857 family protein [Leptolyngbya sp. FACHB-261]MBD2103442.1 hypothetical protein [Leptolyngbya sp. FACHB-261]